MVKVFQARTADDLWQQVRGELLDPNLFEEVQGRNGLTRELAHVALNIDDPRQKWVVSRSPALNPAFALVEVIWILSGRRDSAFLNFFNSQLQKYAGEGDFYYGAYGYRLRKQFEVDQVERAFLALKNNPYSRQVVLQIWDPRSDLPNENGEAVDQDIPCNLISLLKIRDHKLHWTQILRSNDLFRGVPYNLVQFTSIHEVLAGWLGVEAGPYYQLSDSMHIYTSDVKHVTESEPLVILENTDSLALPKVESDYWIRILQERIDTLIHPSLTAGQFDSVAQVMNAPIAFDNAFSVICAEVARRRGWFHRSEKIISRCNNPIYLQLWQRWLDRLQRQKAPKPDIKKQGS